MIPNRHPMTAQQRQRLYLTLTLMLAGLSEEERECAYIAKRARKFARNAAKARARKEAAQ